jgi:acetyl esterase/lipase
MKRVSGSSLVMLILLSLIVVISCSLPESFSKTTSPQVEKPPSSIDSDDVPASEDITKPEKSTGSPGNVTIEKDKSGTLERNITYGNVEDVSLKMDIYYPMKAFEKAPAVVYVHGGGWTKGDKAGGAGKLDISELVSRNYLVAAINYRLAPQHKFPAQIEDAKCAIRFLRANSEKYNIDNEHIGVWGGSAGGHLVALLGVADESAGFEGIGGYANQSSRVQAVVDLFGPSDLTKIFEGSNSRLLQKVFGTPDHDSEIARLASPVNYVSNDDPPFLILHGEEDKLVPLSQSQILYDKLNEAGVQAELVVVKNAAHGFAPAGGQPIPSRPELTEMLADFFDEHLK